MATEATHVIESGLTTVPMSYQEFLAWADEAAHAEWVNGEGVRFMPPKDVHQATLGFLHRLLGLFVDLFDLGQLRVAPFEMRAVPDGAAREPDMLFVARAHLNRLTPERLAGPADLIIEIISAESVQRDRRDKFREYAEVGVREYWIVDPRPRKQRADFFTLTEQGQYELFATEDDERVSSPVLAGFWLKPAWLWQVDTLNPLLCNLENESVAAALTQHLQQRRKAEAGEELPLLNP